MPRPNRDLIRNVSNSGTRAGGAGGSSYVSPYGRPRVGAGASSGGSGTRVTGPGAARSGSQRRTDFSQGRTPNGHATTGARPAGNRFFNANYTPPNRTGSRDGSNQSKGSGPGSLNG